MGQKRNVDDYKGSFFEDRSIFQCSFRKGYPWFLGYEKKDWTHRSLLIIALKQLVQPSKNWSAVVEI